MDRTEPVTLGHIELPEGVLVILDPGLGRFWRHEGSPDSPRRGDAKAHDLRLVGPDAEAAGRAYDREFDPLHLFDVEDPVKAEQAFAAFAKERRFDARAEQVEGRVPHTRRARLALAAGKGLGVVTYNRLWAVAAEGLPQDRPLAVVGHLFQDGRWKGRWQSLEVVVDAAAPAARTERVEGVMVEHGQLLFAGLGPLGDFRMWESHDGLADYVFRGRDAAALAAKVGAAELGDGYYGWKDVPIAQVGRHAQPVQACIAEEELRVGVDYRPHCNLERLNAQLRESPEDVGALTLAGAAALGLGNRWGDGVFPVSRDVDSEGRVLRVRVELATPQRLGLMERVQRLQRGAIVTRYIADGAQPVRFAERLEPRNAGDSGWAFSCGLEDDAYMDDAKNMVIMRLDELVRRAPELEPILDAPVGALYHRDGDRFVEDEP
jgi:hypothetical protein